MYNSVLKTHLTWCSLSLLGLFWCCFLVFRNPLCICIFVFQFFFFLQLPCIILNSLFLDIIDYIINIILFCPETVCSLSFFFSESYSMPSVVTFVFLLLALSKNFNIILFFLFFTLYKITLSLQSLHLCHNMLSLDLHNVSHDTVQISKEQTTQYRIKKPGRLDTSLKLANSFKG